MTLIAIIAVVCVLLLVLGFGAPRWSARPQQGIHRGLDKADEKAGGDETLPKRMTHRSTDLSKRAVDTATEKGREARRQVD